MKNLISIAVITATTSLLLISCDKTTASDNVNDNTGNNYFPPKVTKLEISDKSISILDEVAFTATAEDSSTDGTIEKYLWTIAGKDTVTTNNELKYSFLTKGDKVVSLKVEDNDGVVSEDSKKDTISVSAYEPVLSVMKEASASINKKVTISASASDSDGKIKKFELAFNGDVYQKSFDVDSSSATLDFDTTFTADQAGVYTILVKATDDDNLSTVDSIKVTISADAPVVTMETKDTTVFPGTKLKLIATATDPKGEKIEKFLWALDGTNFDTTTTSGSIEVTFSEIGTHIIKVKVLDVGGISSTESSVTITVAKGKPIVTVSDTIYGNSIVETTISATADDPDGGTIEKFLWALDGSNYDDETADGKIKHLFSEVENYTVKVKAVDNEGNESDSKSITVIITEGIVYAVWDEFNWDSDAIWQ